jgi:hypothetical protein
VKLVITLAVLLGLAAPARAGTHRIAIVVGNNTGADSPALHFAEADASKLARVLVELGGVDGTDLHLLQGASLAQLRSELAATTARIATLHRDPSSRVIVIFYFSGHSDGQALELGGERFAFAELRRWLAASGADVRVALVDSCKSGALLTAKGGTPGPEFQIRLTDELASTGEALLTSSAADEVALESREIGGSFFTQHLVSGLRGAADANGDGTVTLTEAYEYAYGHTIATSGATLIGPQHPAYDYRLTGKGELVLTDVSKPSAVLELPSGFDRVLVVELARSQVVAEITADARRVIALDPGRYAVHAWRGEHAFAGEVTVATNEHRSVRGDELAVATGPFTLAKGGFGLDEEEARALLVAGGVAGGVADHLGASAALRGSWQSGTRGWTAAIDLRTGTGPGFRESALDVHAGYVAGTRRGPLHAWLDLTAGPTLLMQEPTGMPGVSTLGLDVAPGAGVAYELSRGMSIAADAELGGTLLRRDSSTTLAPLAAIWLGVAVRL